MKTAIICAIYYTKEWGLIAAMANIQLSKNLRFKRKEIGLRQEDIGTMLNISRQAYSNYETGNRAPDLDILMKLCDFYHLSLDELVNANLSNRIGETKGPYQFAIEIKSADTLYLTEDEVDLIMNYRDSDEDTRRLIEKLFTK